MKTEGLPLAHRLIRVTETTSDGFAESCRCLQVARLVSPAGFLLLSPSKTAVFSSCAEAAVHMP
jgi:hypothetical protein